MKATSLQPKLFMIIWPVDQNYMRRDRDGSLGGRLNMSNNRVSGLADPTDADDAVPRRCVASRFQALSDEVQDSKSKLDALLNLFGVENNQVLIRVYELIDTDIEYVVRLGHNEREKFTDFFTLKENFMLHLLEEPVDTVKWLRIKQPGTFDLIDSSSFSFELHTKDEIIHFSEHDPKHDIILEMGENCILMYKEIPRITRAGSKIYVYYNI